MSQKINLGLIGFGTVGQSVVSLIRENNKEIVSKTGFELCIKKIAVRSIAKKRAVKVDNSVLTENADEIFSDPEIDIVVEVIGGIEPAKQFIEKAIANNKYVVTANKALLAKFGEELFELAEKNNSDIYFEAAVAGGIPVILPVGLSLCSNKIESIKGILNATCDYILGRMEEGASYELALKEAQEKGFAEADPDFDVSGKDAMQKLVILASLSFGTIFKESDVYLEGITDLKKEDLVNAKKLGYSVKLLAIAKDSPEGLELRVHPTLVPKENLLAFVKGETKVLTIKGNFCGEVSFLGKGAGGKPTASAVVADIINAAQDKFSYKENAVHLIDLKKRKEKKILPMSEINSSYFLSFLLQDFEGTLLKITSIFAENNVNISSVVQEKSSEQGFASLLIITHSCKEKLIKVVLKKISDFKEIKGNVKLIRVEN